MSAGTVHAGTIDASTLDDQKYPGGSREAKRCTSSELVYSCPPPPHPSASAGERARIVSAVFGD